MENWEEVSPDDDGWESEPATEVRSHSMRGIKPLSEELGMLGETMLESVIKMGGDYWRGTQKIASYIPGINDDPEDTRKRLAEEQAEADIGFAPYKEANPIASRVLPFVAEALPATKTLKGAALIGAGIEGLKYSDDQALRAVGGALGGAGGQAIGNKIAKGFNRDPRSQRIYDEGLTTQTVGEQWGPGLASVEEKMASTPGLRGAIGDAKDRSVDAFHRNRINNALREIQPAGQTPGQTPGPIPEAVPAPPMRPGAGPAQLSTDPIPGLNAPQNRLEGPPRDLVPTRQGGTNLPPQQELMARPDMPDMDPRDIPADYAEWEPTIPERSAGMQLPDDVKSGGDAMAYADDIISNEYDDVLNQIDVKFDEQFGVEFARSFKSMENLPDGTRNHVQKLLEDTLHLQTAQTGGMGGRAYREVNTDLRNEAKRMTKATQDAVTQRGGRILEDIQKSMKDMALRQNPHVADRYRAVERAFAKMRVNQDAATKIGATDQIFSPTHYLQSLKKNTDPRLYSHGMGFEQKFAEDAKATLAKKIGNSGTTDRAAMLGTVLGLGAFDPSTAAAVGSGLLLSNKAPQSVISKMLFERPPNAAVKALNAVAPRVGRAGGGILGAESVEGLNRRKRRR